MQRPAAHPAVQIDNDRIKMTDLGGQGHDLVTGWIKGAGLDVTN